VPPLFRRLFRHAPLSQTSCLAVLLLGLFSRPLGAQSELDLLPPAPAPTPTRAPLSSATTATRARLAPTSKRAVKPRPATNRLEEGASSAPLRFPLASPRIVILKSHRRLELYDGTKLVKTYRVSLGANPQGQKTQRGDGRTPEGNFFICTRNDSTTAFHRFMGLSYPALPDAKNGLVRGQISAREYLAITRRLSSRTAPLWGTRLGGWVGIHGEGSGRVALKERRERNSADWTAGCIALSNAEAAELFRATRIGTLVTIRP
jgi:hypothetical protein